MWKNYNLFLSSNNLFLDLSEMGRMEKQFLKHLEQLDAEKKVKDKLFSKL